MPRGGHREGAGRKGGWVNSETQVIRVPKIFASQLLDIARRLDLGDSEIFTSLTLSEVDPVRLIDDSGVPQVNPDQMDLFSLNPEVTEFVTKSNTPPSKPDGLKWLSSEQAFKVSQKRGYLGSLAGFRNWSKRHPEQCSKEFNLFRLPTLRGRTSAPVFEDLQHDGFDPDQHF